MGNNNINNEDDIVMGIDTKGIKKGRDKYKNKISFDVELNEEQQLVKKSMLKDTISVLTGRAGSGKTMLAAQIALEMQFYKEVEKIIITRPMVSDEDLGFLPGDISDKMAPWMAPVVANMQQLAGSEKVKKMQAMGIIEIIPFAFIRGRTFLNSIIIGDEFQNTTVTQMETFLTRLGKNSKMIITGDLKQSDLKTQSGLKWLIEKELVVEGLNYYSLKTNNRHPILDALFDELEKK